MPILSGKLNVDDGGGDDGGGDGGGPYRPGPVWTEDVGTLNATWIDPDGGEWPLSNTSEDLGWFTMNGPAGWGAPPFEIVTDPVPRGGEQVRYVHQKSSRINWPVYVFGRDHEEFVDRYRRLMNAFVLTSMRQSPGALRVGRPSGRFRYATCYYEQGFEGESGENQLWAKPVLQLFCPEGLWYGDRHVRATRDFGTDDGGGGTGSFYNPFLNVTSSKVVSGIAAGAAGDGPNSDDGPTTTIDNPGDVDGWPTWKIRGPMSKLVAENVTTGARFAVTYGLLPEQVIVVTTRRPSVRGPGNTNLTRMVDWFNPVGTQLWPMVKGENEVMFRIDGAGPGTRIEMSFTPRYYAA